MSKAMAEEATLELVGAVPAPEVTEVPTPVRSPRERGEGGSRSIAERALGGDVDAWNALIARHNRRVIVSLLARGMSVERAKDIAQEAWLRLVEQQRAG